MYYKTVTLNAGLVPLNLMYIFNSLCMPLSREFLNEMYIYL